MEWAISMNAGAICSSGVTPLNPRHKDARLCSKQLTSRHCPQGDGEAGQEVLRRERADVVGGFERLRAGQQKHHRGVPEDRVGQLGDGLLPDPLGEAGREDDAQRLGHPLDRRAMMRGGQLDHQAGLVGDHPVQHPVATELQYGEGKCLDVIIRLRPGLFQLGSDVGDRIGIMPGTTICGLADGAGWPVKTAVRKFRREFEDAIKSGAKSKYAKSLEVVGAH